MENLSAPFRREAIAAYRLTRPQPGKQPAENFLPQQTGQNYEPEMNLDQEYEPAGRRRTGDVEQIGEANQRQRFDEPSFFHGVHAPQKENAEQKAVYRDADIPVVRK